MLQIEFSALPAHIQERLIIEPGSSCWLWTGTKGKRGYGMTYRGKGRRTYVHRIIYEMFFGKPRKDHIHHICGIPLCCNPNHLKDVTRKEHKSFHEHWCSKKTLCKNGHPLIVVGNRRKCPVCLREMRKKWKRLHKEKLRASR